MFRALRVTRHQDSASTELVTLDDLEAEGDVTVDVFYSSVNFKDALALTGRPGIITASSLTPGIDLVGTVATSDSPDWAPGDRVIVNGWGMGEKFHGGLSERARVRSEWLVALPTGISASQAAAIGTAGFTSMLSVLALENHGASGEVLVTGATGGVGSIAIALLARLGYSVTAATGKTGEFEYLGSLGATTVIDRAELAEPGKALQSQRWGAVIDSAGSHTLANAIAQTTYGGIVTSAGLAQGADLPSTVMPFILRAVTLQGINSVYCPTPLRREAWARLSTDLDLDLLDSLTATVGLADAVTVAERLMQGGGHGRTVVDVRN
jgi:acrylyl-CoA reductase (NADPH)